MLGKAFGMPRTFSKRDYYGRWAMEPKYEFGGISATQTHMEEAPVQLLDREALVTEIIKKEANWWNVPLIESIFPKEVAEQICNIAISPQLMKDKLIWARTTNGRFTVRSA
jgi:hypothetical protein